MVTEVKSFLYAFCGRQRSLPEYETKPAGRDKNGWMSYFSTVAPTGFPYVGQGSVRLRFLLFLTFQNFTFSNQVLLFVPHENFIFILNLFFFSRKSQNPPNSEIGNHSNAKRSATAAGTSLTIWSSRQLSVIWICAARGKYKHAHCENYNIYVGPNPSRERKLVTFWEKDKF